MTVDILGVWRSLGTAASHRCLKTVAADEDVDVVAREEPKFTAVAEKTRTYGRRRAY